MKPMFPMAALAAALLIPAAAGAAETSAAAPSAAAPELSDPGWTVDYESTLAAAKASGRAVLLFFAGADDASARLERDVFGSAAWKDWAATNAVLVRLDPFLRGGASSAQRALVARLAAQYGVKARPALVLLSPDGAEIGRPDVRAGAPAAFYVRQAVVARYDADHAALRAALGDAKADDYLAQKAAVDAYMTRVDELRRLLNAEARRLQAAYEAAVGEATKETIQAEMNRVLTERVRAYRGYQEGGYEAARAGIEKIEAYRDELAGPEANPLRLFAPAAK